IAWLMPIVACWCLVCQQVFLSGSAMRCQEACCLLGLRHPFGGLTPAASAFLGLLGRPNHFARIFTPTDLGPGYPLRYPPPPHHRRFIMLLHATDPLFAWEHLEDFPTLTTLRDFLATIPDQQLLQGLHAARGHGRDDYPIPRLWRVVLLTIALRLTSFNA